MQDGWALEYASPELQADRDLINDFINDLIAI